MQGHHVLDDQSSMKKAKRENAIHNVKFPHRLISELIFVF